MINSRDLNELNPDVKAGVLAMIAEAKSEGIDLRAIDDDQAAIPEVNDGPHHWQLGSEVRRCPGGQFQFDFVSGTGNYGYLDIVHFVSPFLVFFTGKRPVRIRNVTMLQSEST